jgi:Spy/CpxP family protein refolding chaperone
MLFCALISVALLASAASGQRRTGRANTPGGFAEGRLMKKKAKEIGLSEEIIAKIDAAIEAGNAEEEKIRKESVAAIGELNEMLAKNLPTEKELMAAAKKVGEAASKSRDLKMRSVIEMRSLLTPEQLEKFMEFRRKAAARR